MRILVIEDDPDIGDLIQRMLQQKNFVVDVALTGRSGMNTALKIPYDAVIVDLYLPDILGHMVVNSIRAHKKHLPMLMLTAESDIKNRLKSLQQCDDYLMKPVHMDELVARLYAITRRGKVTYAKVLECADLRMDVDACSVTRAGKVINLRTKEYILLEFLLRNKDTLVTRDQIIDYIWDTGVDPNTNTIDVHIRMLRKKIDVGFSIALIQPVPKRGYRLTSRVV